MIVSTKGRYALRVMVGLAMKDTGEYIPLKEIAEEEDISQKYLVLNSSERAAGG